MKYVEERQLQQKLEDFKRENSNLKDKLKRKDVEIKRIKMNGPDQALLKANVELQSELKDLKEQMDDSDYLDPEKARMAKELRMLKAKDSDQCREIRRLQNRVKDLERIDRTSSIRILGKVQGGV
ncbi:hypothetical protein [Salinicoccus roseus]|uniref:hypothetical protein n=1 Tax=Salinicoccus roseus TaxID=45670 RepID=UPI0023010EFA|nr:hypothetical protein [Salinicoccus roseus]